MKRCVILFFLFIGFLALAALADVPDKELTRQYRGADPGSTGKVMSQSHLVP